MSELHSPTVLRFCPSFWRIKSFGVDLHPLNPQHLHQWINKRLENSQSRTSSWGRRHTLKITISVNWPRINLCVRNAVNSVCSQLGKYARRHTKIKDASYVRITFERFWCHENNVFDDFKVILQSFKPFCFESSYVYFSQRLSCNIANNILILRHSNLN